MNLKDLLSPFYVWQRAFEKPYTSIRPIQERPGSAAYRGFHINVSEQCIGCGTCHAICQNDAIDMVRVEAFEGRNGDSGLRPSNSSALTMSIAPFWQIVWQVPQPIHSSLTLIWKPR